MLSTPYFTYFSGMPFFKTNYSLKSLGNPKVILQRIGEKTVTIIQRKEVRTLTTHDNLSPIALRAKGPFEVLVNPQTSEVLLRNHAYEFKLLKIEGQHCIVVFGETLLFEPFLRLRWLEAMLNGRA